ncbi:putative glycosyl transferase [Calycomorphotria hydatis]|uniref:Putative glycosyl transferase n=2 Tax=Calycomorphotria hydatis TaxID=2528027 RepID=A0A517T7C7_9PLAN|nr:putative glycosyl transferase [Calycomorphotria hydatis]
MRRPRAIVLNRNYPPEHGATGPLLREWCTALSDQWDITLIVGPSSNTALDSTKAPEKSNLPAPKVIRVWGTRFNTSTMLGRFCNLITYYLAAFFVAFLQRRADVVLVQTDPPFLCLAGMLLKLAHRCRLVIVLQDIHPEIGIAIGRIRKGLLTDALQFLFGLAYRSADEIWTPSHDMQSYVHEKYGSKLPVHCVPNWANGEHIFPIEKDKTSQFTVLYSGNIGLTQKLEQLIEAATLLEHRPDIHFQISGSGSGLSELRALLDRRSCKHITLAPPAEKNAINEHLAAADLHFIPLNPAIDRYLMPSKLYANMASGRPILLMATSNTEAAQTILDSDSGWISPPNDIAALAKCIENIAANPTEVVRRGVHAHQTFTHHYDAPIAINRIRERLNNLIALTSDDLYAPEQLNAHT